MPSLRSSGKIVGPSVSLSELARKYRVPKPVTVRKLLAALGVRGSPELAFLFGTHNLPFGNFTDGVPDWDTFLETFGKAEVYHELLDPLFGHPVSTAAFFQLYKHYLKGTANGGLATGFCTSLSSLVADNFWTGAVSHDIDKASVHRRLTAVHGKLLSRESLLHFHDQGLEGVARVERTCREIETILLRGCSRKTAPLLFFIPAGGVWSDEYFAKLDRSHCVMPYRLAYPAGHPGPRLSADGRSTVHDLHGVEMFVWDCNHPDSERCRLVFNNDGGRVGYQYFPGGSTALFSSSEGITLGMMTNGDYMLSDHDLPFSGPLGITRFVLDFLLSPADLQITDASGRRTGRFDGAIHAEIPGSLPCYLVPRAYLLPEDPVLERQITGTGSGQYSFNSLTPQGGSVVLQGLATAPGQRDFLSLSPDQTALRFAPASAKRFDLTVARRVGEEIRAMAIHGIGTDQAAEFRFNTSAEFSFCNLANTGSERKLRVEMLRIDKQGKFSRNLPVTNLNLSASGEVSFDALDWEGMDGGAGRIKNG